MTDGLKIAPLGAIPRWVILRAFLQLVLISTDWSKNLELAFGIFIASV